MVDHWTKVNDIFHEALERHPAERASFLDAACAGDASLRDELDSLIAEHDGAASFLERPLMGPRAAGALWADAGELARAETAERGEDLSGRVLDGKYRVEERRGRGGMGAVYRAVHLGTGREVAVKVIAPEFMANAEFVERFQREARATGRLRHPNVVNVTDFGFARVGSSQRAYLVMEYLEGTTLAELIGERGRLPLPLALDLLEQIGLAVDEAHRLGILHRDLKPENIWLEPTGRGGFNVKVLDFGLAKLRESAPDAEADAPRPASFSPNATLRLSPGESAGPLELRAPETPALFPGEHDETLAPVAPYEDHGGSPTVAPIDGRTAAAGRTRVGMVLGTPKYMSPEQCRGDRLDASSDVYSVGVIAYEMLAGRPPFAGDASELLVKHGEMPPPPIGAPRRAVPAAVEEVVLRALSKDRASRPPTAGAFAAALRVNAGGEREVRRRARQVFTKHRGAFVRVAEVVFLPFLAVTIPPVVGLYLAPPVLSAGAFVLRGAVWLAIWLVLLTAGASLSGVAAVFLERLGGGAKVGAGTAELLVIRRAPAVVATLAAGASRWLARRANRPSLASSLLVGPVVVAEGLEGDAALARATRLASAVPSVMRAALVRALADSILMFAAYQTAFVLVGALPQSFAPFLLLLAVVPFLALPASLSAAAAYACARSVAGERSAAAEALALPALARTPRSPRLAPAVYAAVVLAGALLGQAMKSELLWDSVRAGDGGVARGLIAAGAIGEIWPGPGDSEDEIGIGFEAARRSSTVRLALEGGGDPNAMFRVPDGWGRPFVKQTMRASALECAAMGADWSGDTGPVTLLLDHGADVRARDSLGGTPLMAAAAFNPIMIPPLVEHGADVNEVTERGTALMSAAQFWGCGSNMGDEKLRDPDPVGLLLDRGADPNARDAAGRTPLMVLSIEYRPDGVILPEAERLLAAGGDVNARDAEGRTPLMYAVLHRQRATIELLVAAGADPNARDASGASVLDLARQTGRVDIVRAIAAAGAKER